MIELELERVRSDPRYASNFVPRSWELIRLPPGTRANQLQTVAWHIAAFDLAADGTIVYTNGYDVMQWRDGETLGIGRHEPVVKTAVR